MLEFTDPLQARMQTHNLHCVPDGGLHLRRNQQGPIRGMGYYISSGLVLLVGKVCHIFAETEDAMVTMNISLPDPMKSWVEDQAKSGRFANSSDYVRDLIRRDRARFEAMTEIQSAIDAGLASGEATVFDRDTFKARMRAERGG